MTEVLVEARGVIQRDRSSFKQRPMAEAAFATIMQSFARNPVDRIAMRADDVQWLHHYLNGLLHERS